jgi:ATP-dependent protease La (LON) substrate-binding domain
MSSSAVAFAFAGFPCVSAQHKLALSRTRAYSAVSRRRRPRACAVPPSSLPGPDAAQPTPPGPSSDYEGLNRPQERVLRVVTAPMTDGADVLFPGGSQMVHLHARGSLDALRTVIEEDPPEFGFVCVDAWGDACDVGTMAVVDDLELRGSAMEARLLCSGMTRFKVVEMSEDRKSAKVVLFHDDDPEESERDEYISLEDSLVQSMNSIVQLSIKLSRSDNERGKQTALAGTLQRMEKYFSRSKSVTRHEDGNAEEKDGRSEDSDIDTGDVNSDVDSEDDEDSADFLPHHVLQHWVGGLDEDRRRELLSFIVFDLTNMTFMDRLRMLRSTNTKERLGQAQEALEPFLKELVAKGAILEALGSMSTDFP